jgi:UDP-N-acetylmuramoylalanine--D-glutamate ligase
MGLGRFGGGLGVTRYLLSQGAHVLLTDMQDESALATPLSQLGDHKNLTLSLGRHRVADFEQADVVVANPAVKKPWENRYLRAAWDSNTHVTTEIQLVVEQLDRKNVIGVTGSAGKSTTASMLYAALQRGGVPSVLGGNIGGSLLQTVSEMQEGTIVILELSSAMLWWLGHADGICWSPHIAVLTNISPNHLDWHTTMESYVECKKNIFKFQTKGDVAIRGEALRPSSRTLSVLGSHNLRNAEMALKAAVEIGCDPELAKEGIEQFRGLPHRLERMSDSIVNDSKSTTPEATALAVDSFENPSRVHLIVGGYNKNIDLQSLSAQADRVAYLYAIGETADTIVSNVRSGNSMNCGTLEVAVSKAKKQMREGDVLLLSPGCASLDQFDHYEHRGETFCKLTGC